MTVRAKFVVESVTMQKAWNGTGLIGTVALRPVTRGSPENEKFYEATPGGDMKLSTVNQEALDFFQIGAEFYVDFTAAPKV